MKYKIMHIPPGETLAPGIYTVQVESVEFPEDQEPYVALRFLERVPEDA